jgi:hypothetical protein
MNKQELTSIDDKERAMKQLELRSSEEDAALALSNFLDEGYEGHTPTYAEEQLAYLALKNS